MWNMLFGEWRDWRRDAVEKIGQDNESLDEPVCIDNMSVKRSKRINVLSRENLVRIGWMEFKEVIEDTLILPIVPCPFGCSEYVH